MKQRCPCHSGQSYTHCCQPWHLGQAAPDAERLMRSRYSAYVLKLPDYLLHSWHPETRPQQLSVEDLQGITWLKLEVLSHQQADDTHAEVTFAATYRSGQQKKAILTEHSLFERIDGHWLYCGQREP